MLNAAKIIETDTHDAIGLRRVSRYLPNDPAQVAFRRLLSELDEEQLMSVETDLEYYLAGGTMSKRLTSLLDAGDRAA